MYNKPTDEELEQVWDFNLTNHTPTEDGIKKIETLREAAKDYVEAVIKLCPESRERSIALTQFDMANQQAISAIARTETNDIKPIIGGAK